EQVVAGAAGERHRAAEPRGVENTVAIAAGELRLVDAGQRSLAEGADQVRVRERDGAIGLHFHRPGFRASLDVIVAGAGDQDVVALAAKELVASRAAVERDGPGKATGVQIVGPGAPGQLSSLNIAKCDGVLTSNQVVIKELEIDVTA